MRRVISVKRLREFWERHPDAETPLREWYKIACQADWSNLQDVRSTYAGADAVQVASGATVTVFNIKDNRYRLIASIWYEGRQVYVKRVLTHAEYSKDMWKKQL